MSKHRKGRKGEAAVSDRRFGENIDTLVVKARPRGEREQLTLTEARTVQRLKQENVIQAVTIRDDGVIDLESRDEYLACLIPLEDTIRAAWPSATLTWRIQRATREGLASLFGEDCPRWILSVKRSS